MRKLLLLLFAFAFIGCSNYWAAGTAVTPAAGFLKFVDIGVTTSDSFTYRIDACLLSPYLLGLHSGPLDWHGYAWGIMGGKIVSGEPVTCCWPWAST